MLRIAIVVVAFLAGAAALAQGAGAAAEAARAEALSGLSDARTSRRVEAIVWFAQNGVASDDTHLFPRLADDDRLVRGLAEKALWMLWSRSGDAAVDALMERGLEEVASRDYDAAIATYSEVIRRRPGFAEGWNKRATVHFLAGDFARSLADCDQVMKRNPRHFGALSGYGQIYFHQQRYDKAIEYWRRALEVNPNLEGLESNIDAAERLRERSRGNQVRGSDPARFSSRV
jgi:tetratricopeptide (TPR) repeat protein